MSSIITSIISSVLGLVLNRARNTVADKLKEKGDIADEKLRNVIVEDLKDIKTKIDGLARKDLFASCELLEEGIATLNLALDEAQGEQACKDEDGGSKTTETATKNRRESGVLNEYVELSNTQIQRLKNTSNTRLITAKECFKAARERATDAFGDKALSLPDRIMATKLRIVAKILECLQDTKAAAVGYMLFLEKLHNLPAIEETFSTYFKRGIKSRVYKDSRLENVKSVLSLNFGISEFAARFSGELPDVRNWPRIRLSNRGKSIHPLVIDPEIVKKIFDTEEFQLPENHLILDGIYFWKCFANSNGELLVHENSKPEQVNILDRTGNTKPFCELRQATSDSREGLLQVLQVLVLDGEDNVFVIIRVRDRSLQFALVLFVFDSRGNEQHQRLLDFLECGSTYRTFLNCAVKNDILIHRNCEDFLYVCDRNGELKSRLSLENSSAGLCLVCITNQDDILMRTERDVLVYTKEGKLKRTIKVKNDIEAVSYDHVTSKIEILVKKELSSGSTYNILSYSESDEVIERLYLPVNNRDLRIRFCQHYGTSTALVKNHSKGTLVTFM